MYCLLDPDFSGIGCLGPRSLAGPPARSQLRPTADSRLLAGRVVVLGEDRAEGEELEGPDAAGWKTQWGPGAHVGS